MSVIVINRAIPSIFERAHALLQCLLPTENVQSRGDNALKNLPDYLLIDIGIDPRNMPCSLDEVIAHPDLAHGGVVTSGFRTAAKS